MELLKINEILQACGGRLLCGEGDADVSMITTDSRQSAAGALFVALKGERFDGHDFVAEFLKKGLAAIIDVQPTYPLTSLQGKYLILVDNTLAALRAIAKHYRRKFPIPVVGITGSVGKTSTKDMIASVLSEGLCTHKTLGNFNNEIGLPLSVFNIESSHQVSVLELGMNTKGEISRLTDIAMPEVAVITNIGTAHIGNLGSKEGILSAKLEILERLSPNGLLILNGDDPMLWDLRGKLPHHTIYYGIDNYFSDLVAYDIILGSDKSKFKASIKDDTYSASINAIGRHHIFNALAAILTGLYFGLDSNKIVEGIANFTTGAMRQNIYKLRESLIIEDCYNANPDSMLSALEVLYKLSDDNAVAILGDMAELGVYSEEAHKEVGEYCARSGVKTLILVGKEVKHLAKTASEGGVPNIFIFDSKEQAAEFAKPYTMENNVILIKASRSMKFEHLVAQLKE